ncbi:MAG: ATP-binding protein [Thermodesulfobacteriota bacterium]|nr:ATP-binding protein [Thermodesulfobacteriota bacterium]
MSDKTLVVRIVGHMLKNALEASSPGEPVLAGCEPVGDKHIGFWVQNPQFIPEETQHQIFKRSFSAKGAGRGIGTYSMKMLSEQYLKGTVDFTTNAEEGTVLRATFPLALD